MATQPDLDFVSEEIRTTTQSGAAEIKLNTENRFAIPMNNGSVWIKHRGQKEQYVAIKIEFNEPGKASNLDAFYDSTTFGSRDDLFRSSDQRTILAVVPTHQGVTNQFSLASADSHHSGSKGTIVFTELNKETLGLSSDEVLVEMRAEMKSENCIKQETEADQFFRISNKSLKFNYFMVINFEDKYIRFLNSDVKETFRIYGNELEYDSVSKSVGYGWIKESYTTSSGEIIINVEEGTLSDQSRGEGVYKLDNEKTKTCDEYYYDHGKVILQ